MTLGTLPTDRTPARRAPLFDNIPAELRARPQWIVWRYGRKVKGKKPKKVPFIPGVGDPASTTDPETWRSFADAVAFYHSRSTYYDGIGYVFSKDDPYVGGDIDHCFEAGQLNDFAIAHLPATYAEISPSGDGVKWIALATGTYGIKKTLGELYSSKRYFTFTGNVLPGHETITEQQESVERFATAICGGESGRKSSYATSGAGNGSRAQLAADVPESEWEAGRKLLRTQRDNLIGRITAAAGEETQLALLLRDDYAEFHRRWPFVGLYRADGTLDASQVRAVAANGIRPRNFTFPEFCAIMSALYAADALAKWGTKDSWRAELASLWHKAPEPRYTRRTKTKIKVARGRAGNHAALVEQVYAYLLNHPTVKSGVIAAAIGCHRRTIVTILNELRAADRIETTPLGQHGGLTISIKPGVIYSATQAPVCPIPAPEIEPTPLAIEETEYTNSVSSQIARDDHTLSVLLALAQNYLGLPARWVVVQWVAAWYDVTPTAPPWQVICVWLLAPPTLPDLAQNYLDLPATEIGERCVSSNTGVVTYRRTAEHFAGLVVLNYGERYTFDAALAAYAIEQQYRKDEAAKEWQRFFARLKKMTNDELIAYIAGRCRTEVHEMTREGTTFDKHQYQTRLKCARQQLAWRGLTMPSRKTRIEQQALLDAERAQQARQRATPPKHRIVACQPVRYEQPASVDSGEAMRASLFENIRALQPPGGP